MLVTAMVMSAVAAFALAVSNCWKYSDSSQAMALTGNQAVARIQRYLLDARRLGCCQTAEPAVVYWQSDSNGDGLMQFSELAMLRYDGPNRTFEFRRATLAPGSPDADVSYAELTAAGVVPRVLASSTPTPLLRNVAAAQIAVDHANDPVLAPTVQVMLTFSAPSPSQPGVTQVVATTLRGPAPAQ
jgi:hypothetical protein